MSTTTPIAAPPPVNNCPDCTLWQPPGSLACPDCHAILYTQHLRRLAAIATQQETAQEWGAARDTWHQALHWLPPDTTQAQAVRDHIAQIDARSHAAADKKARWTKRLGPFAPVAVFLLKAKSFFFILLKFKFLLSFLAYFGVYWALFGWRFALGFTLAILVHEMGHYITARRRGLKVDLPFFLPGLGAYVRWYSQGITLETLCAVALAGPLYGLFFAIACLTYAHYTGSQLFLVLASTTAFINLFNFVPFFGLDGDQATYALNRLQRLLIAITCVLLFSFLYTSATVGAWIYLVIAAVMVWRLFTGIAPEQPSTRGMIGFTLLLIALGAILWAAPGTTRFPTITN